MSLPHSIRREESTAEAWSGISDCRQGKWERGFETLRGLAESDPPRDVVPNLYYSYLGVGLAAYESKYKRGLELCQKGIQTGFLEPDNYLNLARIYWLRDRLDLAHDAHGCGLEIDPEHHRIRRLRRVLGQRQLVTLPFLPRSHWLNLLLGRLRRDLQRRGRPAEQLSGESLTNLWLA